MNHCLCLCLPHLASQQGALPKVLPWAQAGQHVAAVPHNRCALRYRYMQAQDVVEAMWAVLQSGLRTLIPALIC